jgi:hypothetical protein
MIFFDHFSHPFFSGTLVEFQIIFREQSLLAGRLLTRCEQLEDVNITRCTIAASVAALSVSCGFARTD